MLRENYTTKPCAQLFFVEIRRKLQVYIVKCGLTWEEVGLLRLRDHGLELLLSSAGPEGGWYASSDWTFF